VLGDEGTRFVCIENEITFSSLKTFEFEYIEQAYLSVSSEYSAPEGEGWYNIGTSVVFGVEEAVSQPGLLGTLGAKFKFSHWEGDFSSNLPITTISLDEPQQVIAVWKTDNTIMYYNSGLAVFGLTIIILIIRRARK